jgi:hypothetical protein
MNLCANAEYAMRGTGGVLEVQLAPVEVTVDCPSVQPPPLSRAVCAVDGPG